MLLIPTVELKTQDKPYPNEYNKFIAVHEFVIAFIAVLELTNTAVCPGKVKTVEKSEYLPPSVDNNVSKQDPVIDPVSIAFNVLKPLTIGMVVSP